MLRSSNDLKDFSIAATDGDIGQLEEFCFDENWKIQHLVVNVGGWLHPRKALMSPRAAGTVDWTLRAITTELTRQEVRACARARPQQPARSRLRSTRDLDGFTLAAKDGEIGHIDDFIIDDEAWVIRYVVVDTRNWVPAKKVTIAPRWISGIDSQRRRVTVKLSRRDIRNSPEYDDSSTIDREYEQRLHEHYGGPDSGTAD